MPAIMDIKIIREKISKEELCQMAVANYGDMIKGVVDLNKKIIALGGELHADAEEVLLRQGSRQSDLWGFNLFVDKPVAERVVYTSLINIRPNQGNRSMEINDAKLKDQIRHIIDAWVEQ